MSNEDIHNWNLFFEIYDKGTKEQIDEVMALMVRYYGGNRVAEAIQDRAAGTPLVNGLQVKITKRKKHSRWINTIVLNLIFFVIVLAWVLLVIWVLS